MTGASHQHQPAGTYLPDFSMSAGCRAEGVGSKAQREYPALVLVSMAHAMGDAAKGYVGPLSYAERQALLDCATDLATRALR